MTKDEALVLHAELAAMLGEDPADDPDGRRRVEAIRFQYRTASGSTSYIREKVEQVSSDLNAWLSPRKWRSLNADPAQARQAVLQSLYKLSNAIESQWQEVV